MDSVGHGIMENEFRNVDQPSTYLFRRTLRPVFTLGLSTLLRSFGKPSGRRGCTSRGVCKSSPRPGFIQGRVFSHDLALSNRNKSLSECNSLEQTKEYQASTPGRFRGLSQECISRKDGSGCHCSAGFTQVQRENSTNGHLLFCGWNGPRGDCNSGRIECSNREEAFEVIYCQG